MKNTTTPNKSLSLSIVSPISSITHIEKHLWSNQQSYATALSNRLRINSLGSELVGLIGNGLEKNNLTAIKHWILKQSNLIDSKQDISNSYFEILCIQLRCDIYDALEDSLSA